MVRLVYTHYKVQIAQLHSGLHYTRCVAHNAVQCLHHFECFTPIPLFVKYTAHGPPLTSLR